MRFDELLDSYSLTADFPLDVMEEADGVSDTVDAKAYPKRRDLTGTNIFTIDGADAKDLDDAVSIEQSVDGGFRLGVHIADVSHYVADGSPLDREARSRGTSVYLIDKVIPMLPQRLSNGICSLNPQVPRLTLSVVMEIDRFGSVESYEIFESIITTKHRMTYTDITAILEGDRKTCEKYREYIEDFQLMEKLAEILRKRRSKRGALDFDFPEAKIILDETGKPIDLQQAEITVSNKIIEEFMLKCNETVAEHMEQLELPLIYRVHEEPQGDKISKFALMLKGLGYKARLDKEVTPRKLQEVLKMVSGKDEEQAVSTIMLRSLMKARYHSENLGHFGLASNYYCHFTSPIRRYPDLVVHRIVKEWLAGTLNDKKKAYYSKFVEKASDESSDAEVQAVEAERTWAQVKMCEYMVDKVGEDFEGFISSVTSFGLYVQLPNLAEGLVPVGEMKNDYYMFDEVHYLLRGRRTGIVYKIGDKIKVKLVQVDLKMNHIDFIPLEEKRPSKKKNPNFPKKNYNKKRRKG